MRRPSLPKIVPSVHKWAVYETSFGDTENRGRSTAEATTGSSEAAGRWVVGVASVGVSRIIGYRE